MYSPQQLAHMELAAIYHQHQQMAAMAAAHGHSHFPNGSPAPRVGHPPAPYSPGTPMMGRQASASNTPVRTMAKRNQSAPGGVTTPATKTRMQNAKAVSEHMDASKDLPSAGGDKRPTGKHLERDLALASREELVQILLDLASCNEQAASFIESKAQLIALCGSNSPTYNDHGPVMTPMKEQGVLVEQQLNMDSTPTPVSKASKDVSAPNSIEGTPLPNLNITRTPKTPAGTIRAELEERYITPENRPFSKDIHPCLHSFGHCRHPTSCLFNRMPANLCLYWIRGQCNNPDCPNVHRLPLDAPEPLVHIYQLNHEGKAPKMAITPPSTPQPKPVMRCLDDSMSQAADTPARH